MSKAREPSHIAPDYLYTLKGFQAVSGISPTRIREARRRGVEVNWINVGRRKFLRGVDAIAFILELAELERQSRESDSQPLTCTVVPNSQ